MKIYTTRQFSGNQACFGRNDANLHIVVVFVGVGVKHTILLQLLCNHYLLLQSLFMKLFVIDLEDQLLFADYHSRYASCNRLFLNSCFS